MNNFDKWHSDHWEMFAYGYTKSGQDSQYYTVLPHSLRPKQMPRDLTPEDEKYLASAFTYHAPKDDQPERYNTIRLLARALAQNIIKNSYPSRERSLALTNLEQAVMWANAGIARNE